jgi:hypothetical protein
MNSPLRWTEVRLGAAAALLAAAMQAGCGSPARQEDVGTVRVAITIVPADVGCIALTAMAASRTVSRQFDVAPGASSVLVMSGVPTGSVAFSGQAFTGACATVGTGTAATWASDPVTAQISAGMTADVTLVMHHNGNANVHVDFQDDGTAQPTCTDGVRNGNESDVDCGGGTCPICAAGRQCRTGADCASAVCTGGLCVDVSPVATTTALDVTPNPAVTGQVVTLTATVTSAMGQMPAGSVTFFDNGDPTQVVPLNPSGVARLINSHISFGTHNFAGVYNMPTGPFQTSTSPVVTETVNPAATATTLSVPSSFVISNGLYLVQTGTTVDFVSGVTVQPPGAGTPTGNVVFSFEGGQGMDFPSALTGGTTDIITTLSPAGPVRLTARYGGAFGIGPSNSTPLTFVVLDQLPPSSCFAPSGVVSWWRGEGDFSDGISNNNGFPESNVSFAPGFNGQGFNLDGTDFVEVDDSPSLDVRAGVTIDAWINTTTGGGRIVDKITGFSNDGFMLDLVGGGALRMQVGGVGAQAGVAVPFGQFVHVAGTFDGMRLAVFVNGQIQSETGTGSQATVPLNARNLRIGADSAGGSLFTGVIDEVRIFNRGLSDGEIATLFAQGTTCH